MSAIEDKKPGSKGNVGYCKPPVEHQFAPGHVSGGRPKGSLSLTTILRKMLDCSVPAEAKEALRKRYPTLTDEQFTQAHIIMAKLNSQAIKGEQWAIKEILDRMEGKAKEKIDINAKGGFDVTIKFADGDSAKIDV